MSGEFRFIAAPTADMIRRISDLAPDNPFYTNEYVQVRERLGAQPIAFTVVQGSGLLTGCLGFLTKGRINARLEITSLPPVVDKTPFWEGLFSSCGKLGVSVLSVNTFSSTESEIEFVERPFLHKKRSEYRLDLTAPDLWSVMNRRHHRLIRRARGMGLSIRRSNDAVSRSLHAQLANASLDRHRGNGRRVDGQIALSQVDAFVECGSGEIFQAVRRSEVFSTILIARSRTGAYAQSSGTSDTGRSMGSSHFLFHEVAQVLKSEGLDLFNLGGADSENIGLQEFKLGQGAKRIDLESAEFFVGSPIRKLISRAASLLKE